MSDWVTYWAVLIICTSLAIFYTYFTHILRHGKFQNFIFFYPFPLWSLVLCEKTIRQRRLLCRVAIWLPAGNGKPNLKNSISRNNNNNKRNNNNNKKATTLRIIVRGYLSAAGKHNFKSKSSTYFWVFVVVNFSLHYYGVIKVFFTGFREKSFLASGKGVEGGWWKAGGKGGWMGRTL